MSLQPNIKTKLLINGREYVSVDRMPTRIRKALAKTIGATSILRYEARLATKLNTRIIVNDKEFTSPGDIPVAERKLYQDALAALLPSTLATTTNPVPSNLRKILLSLLLAGRSSAILFSRLIGNNQARSRR
jgi:hypothetical protein